MKKNVLALSIAAMVAGFAGGASAMTVADNDPAAAATKLIVGNSGTGHMLVVPYFSTQAANATLLSVINTDTVNGKAVKVRFRGAANSDDIFDFQVFLSPGDVWTAEVSQNAQGVSRLVTNDASCTKPAKETINSTPFITSRLNPKLSAEEKANQTREGYIEIFNMADIPPVTTNTGVYPLIKHVNGVAPCANVTANGVANTAWTDLNTNTDAGGLAALGLARPTTGLAANWTLINVPKAVAWSGTATGIEAVNADNNPVAAKYVYFPQSQVSAAGLAAQFTADPLLNTTSVTSGGVTTTVPAAVAPALYDLPDMSTPYVAGTPAAQATALSRALAATSVINEYWTDPAIAAATDWVFSMPTRRYAAAVKYPAAGSDASVKPVAVYNPGNIGYFTADNTTLVGDRLCVRNISTGPWDREERKPQAADDVVISPGVPGEAVLFCGEVSVLSFNNAASSVSGVISGTVAVKDIDVGFQDGWMRLDTPGAVAANGLPVLGQAFVSAYNPQVSDGTSGNYNIGWSHRYIRPVNSPL